MIFLGLLSAAFAFVLVTTFLTIFSFLLACLKHSLVWGGGCLSITLAIGRGRMSSKIGLFHSQQFVFNLNVLPLRFLVNVTFHNATFTIVTLALDKVLQSDLATNGER